MKNILLFVFSLLLLAIGASSHAGEALFGYSYTTDLVPQGHFEFEQWITDREGQAHGWFHHLDMRSEVEYGITNNFQISVYADYMYADESGNSVAGKTEGIEIPASHNSDNRYAKGRFDGVSIELLYRLLNPYTDAFGLAVYIEPEFGYYERGIEYRLIAQKNFLDDQLVFAANIWVEFEEEVGSNLMDPGSTATPDGAFSKATYAEIDLGGTYRFAPKWSAGLEFRNHNEYGGYTLAHSEQDHTAFFAGPVIHYATQNWFATLSVVKQLWAVAYTDEQKAQMSHGLLYGDEHTSWDGIRLKVGLPF